MTGTVDHLTALPLALLTGGKNAESHSKKFASPYLSCSPHATPQV